MVVGLARNLFLQSHGAQAPHLLALMNANPAVRAEAMQGFASPGYADHVGHYLNFHRAHGGFPFFAEALTSEEIDAIESRTRDEYVSHTRAVFGVSSFGGESLFHRMMDPGHYMTPELRDALAPREGLKFFDMFFELMGHLPRDLDYDVAFVMNDTIPGGFYDPAHKAIAMGIRAPNVRTIMGLGHEFGHSVYHAAIGIVDENSERALSDLAANEAYAEVWARAVHEHGLIKDVFAASDNAEGLNLYLRYMDLMLLRYELYATVMERAAFDAATTSASYLERSRREGARFMDIGDFPPVAPVIARSAVPCYDQAGLWAIFLKHAFLNHPSASDPVGDLIRLAYEFRGRGSGRHYKKLLLGAKEVFFDSYPL